jgi:MerR family transcriptional regulator/heat shock protein HspR
MVQSRYTMKYVCERLDISPRTVRNYVSEGLVETVEEGLEGQVAFDREGLDRICKIVRLRRDLGINLAGIDVIIRLCEHIEKLQHEVIRLGGDVRERRGRRQTSAARAPAGGTVRIEVTEDD